MSLEELDREADAKLQESRSLAEKLDALVESFDFRCAGVVNEYLRMKLIQEIDDIAKRIREWIDKKEMRFRNSLSYTPTRRYGYGESTSDT